MPLKISQSLLNQDVGDGILGLAWSSINQVIPEQQKTPVENMIIQGVVEKGLFSVSLNRGADGFYTFGAIDAAKAGVEESE